MSTLGGPYDIPRFGQQRSRVSFPERAGILGSGTCIGNPVMPLPRLEAPAGLVAAKEAWESVADELGPTEAILEGAELLRTLRANSKANEPECSIALRAENERLKSEVAFEKNASDSLQRRCEEWRSIAKGAMENYTRAKEALEFSLSENKWQFEAGGERNAEIAALHRRCCELGAENKRLKVDLGAVIAKRHQLANDLACRALPAAAPASGPSWLDRIATGPQRIGRPLP